MRNTDSKAVRQTRTETFYAVELPSRLAPYRLHLALCGLNSAGPRLSYFRRDAVALKRTLSLDGRRRARVVKVQVTYRWS